MRRQTGIALIGLLLAIALVGIVVGTAADVYQQRRQRDRESELLWIGDQYRSAIIAYRDASPGPLKTYPPTLDHLLTDPRFAGTRRHLRRLYPDPMTGKPDWEIIPAPQGGIAGVRSRSTTSTLKQDGFRSRDAFLQGRTRYSEWEFSALPPLPTPAQPGRPVK